MDVTVTGCDDAGASARAQLNQPWVRQVDSSPWRLPPALPLPACDTRFTTCADASGASVSCTATSAVQGRMRATVAMPQRAPVRLTKVGGGANRLFTRRSAMPGCGAADHAIQAAPAGEWAVPTTANRIDVGGEDDVGSAPSSADYYSWFDSNPATNGGSVGVSMEAVVRQSDGCDTEKIPQDVNAAEACMVATTGACRLIENCMAYFAWARHPYSDTGYFPNTVDGCFGRRACC